MIYSPLGDEPTTRPRGSPCSHAGDGRSQADLTYKDLLSRATHHAAYFRLEVEDTVVDGMDYILLDADASRRGHHLLAPAAVRRRAAAHSCGFTRHAALGTAHERGVGELRALCQAHQAGMRARPARLQPSPRFLGWLRNRNSEFFTWVNSFD